MTSNIGATEILEPRRLGFAAAADTAAEHERMKDSVRQALERTFRPEFLNRLDEIVFYKPLTRADIGHIIDLQIAGLNRRLEQQQLTLQVTERAKDFIVAESYDPAYGARPLRRYVQHTIETKLSRLLLSGRILPGQTVTADAENGEIVLKAN